MTTAPQDAMRVVKLYPQQADRLALVARVDGGTVTSATRAAVEAYIAARSADPSFTAKLRAVQEAERVLRDQLAPSA